MASPTEKKCNRCGETKPRADFPVRRNRRDGLHFLCRDCDRVYDRQKAIKYRYGMTEEDYLVLLAKQAGGCAICGEPPKKRRLHIDHDHATGVIRGLLCFRCNCSIGYMRESPDLLRKAAEYIGSSSGRSVPMTEVSRRARREIN